MVCTEDQVKKVIEEAYRRGLRDAKSVSSEKLSIRSFLLVSQVVAYEFYTKLKNGK